MRMIATFCSNFLPVLDQLAVFGKFKPSFLSVVPESLGEGRETNYYNPVFEWSLIGSFCC